MNLRIQLIFFCSVIKYTSHKFFVVKGKLSKKSNKRLSIYFSLRLFGKNYKIQRWKRDFFSLESGQWGILKVTLAHCCKLTFPQCIWGQLKLTFSYYVSSIWNVCTRRAGREDKIPHRIWIKMTIFSTQWLRQKKWTISWN